MTVYPQFQQRTRMEYETHTAEFIEKQARTAYQLGQPAMLNGLVQNAVEVLNCRKIKIIIRGTKFWILNDGDKPYTKEDAKTIHLSKKIGMIGQLGEETKLAIGWMKDRKLTFISRDIDGVVRGFELSKDCPYEIGSEETSRYELPEEYRTVVFGTLEDAPNVKELITFLVAIHNYNISKGVYEIIMQNNDEEHILTARLPPKPKIIYELLKGKNAEGNIVTDHLSILQWSDADWSGVICPYSHPNGVYILHRGVLISYIPLWDTQAHKKNFTIINDVEGELFTTLITRDKQIPNLTAPVMKDTNKLWKRIIPKEPESTTEDQDKASTERLREMFKGKPLIHYVCLEPDCGIEWTDTEICKVCPECGSKNIQKVIKPTEKENTYLWRCTDNDIPQDVWNMPLKKIQKTHTIVGCCIEIVNKDRINIPICTCGHPMKRVVLPSDHLNKKLSVKSVSEETYLTTPYLNLGDFTEGIITRNILDPLDEVHKDEFDVKGKYSQVYGILMDIGTTMLKKDMSQEEEKNEKFRLIEVFNNWRKDKKSQILKAKRDLIKNKETRPWFKYY
jgi:hypothetical protein